MVLGFKLLGVKKLLLLIGNDKNSNYSCKGKDIIFAPYGLLTG